MEKRALLDCGVLKNVNSAVGDETARRLIIERTDEACVEKGKFSTAM